MNKVKILYFLIFIQLVAFSQRSKHGAQTIAAVNVIVNEYTTLTANAFTGNTSITVANSALNANGRFTTPLQVGDLIMIIQMQGATIKTFATVAGQDSTYGDILNYNSAGNYEFAEVFSIPNVNTIVLDCGLTNSYSVSGKTQIVRIPRYSAFTVNAGASLTGDVWNGTVGGVISVEVNGASTINGSVTATALGFRGGIAVNNGGFGGSRYVDLGGGANEGGEKGESIAGSSVDYATLYGGQYARGAPANGGGGGDSHNAGGGGGANAGNTATWSGYGVINAAYTVNYNLEYPGRAAVVSSGGGRGGYCFSSAGLNPNVNAPNNAAWTGDQRRTVGGLGGRPLNYSTGKLFLGGGGGAGHVNNLGGSNVGGTGGIGGGLIYFITYGATSGAGVVVSNGQNGTTATGAGPGIGSYVGNDSGGGGGGGGTIVFNSTSATTGVTINANGGNGGNQTIVKGAFVGTVNEAEGPGGGGGGGYIAVSSGAPVQTALGASSGTTNSNAMTNFPPNGATNGANGLTNQAITLYTLSANPVTICVNNAATLNATSNNAGASFLWFNNIVGTTQIGTGAVFTTSVFTTVGTYTVFAAMCPGIYRIPVVITVTNGPTLTATSQTICSGQTATLVASGATTYTWNTGATSATLNPSPVANTVYTVIGASGTCSTSTSASVTVNAGGAIAVNSATICSGQTATLAAGAALSFTWSTTQNIQTINVNPLTTTVYTINATIGAGCIATNTSTVTIIANPTITVTNASICVGQTATLTALGAISYLWYDGSISPTNTVNPISTSSYSLTGSVNGCTASATGSVVVTPNPTVSATSVSICAGQIASLTGIGATSYTWNLTGINFVGTTFTTAPASTTVYSVSGSISGCVGSNTVNVSVGSNLSIAVNSPTICAGQTTTLSAVSTATNYSWSNGALTNSTTVSPPVNTSFTVNGNFAGCTGSAVVNVVVNANPILINSNPSICIGQSATLIASGATSYTWSTASTATTIVVSPVTNTTYSLIGANGSCTASTNYNVVVNNLPIITTNSANICNGNSATLTANGATTYTWLPLGTTSNTISVNPSSNTNYTVIGSTSGCTTIATASVVVTTGGTVSVNGATVCNGQNAIIGTPVIGTSYLWDNGATTQSISVSPNVNTTYSLQVVSGGCILTGTTTVGITAAPIITVNSANICIGNNATLFANGASNYTWTPGNISANSINVSPAITTNYVVSSFTNGCTSTATAQVIVNTKPTLSITPFNPLICPNTPITLSASGATSYDWFVDGIYHFGNPITITPSKTSNITVIGSNGGCTSTSLTTVFVSTLTATFNAESNYVDYPGSLSFTNTSNGYNSFLWDFGNGQTSTNNISTAFYETPGKYLVTLLTRDALGCADTTFYIIEAGCGNGDIFIPNTFTPNNDGLNDSFKIFGGTCLTAFSATIFDRWGHPIFKFKNLADAWDGKVKDTDVEIGTYNYLINYTLYNGKQYSKAGVVTVER